MAKILIGLWSYDSRSNSGSGQTYTPNAMAITVMTAINALRPNCHDRLEPMPKV